MNDISEEYVQILRTMRKELSHLQGISQEYKNQNIDHNLDGNVFFQLELLYERVTTILLNIKLGSMNLNELIKEPINPFYDFGYLKDDFIDKLE